MAFSFTEEAPHEEGFTEVFHRDIVPILERKETLRHKLARQAKMGMAGGGVVGVGGFGSGFGMDTQVGFFAGGAGGLGAFGAYAYFQNKWKGGLGEEILPVLCNFLGGIDYGQQKISLSDFTQLGLLPGYNTSSMEDPVSGSHDGLDWAMTEAILKSRTRDSKGRTSTRTVFRGLLFQVQIVGPAPRIFFGRDRGGIGNWFSETFSSSRRGMEKIEVDHPEFENTYEVYSSDPAAARGYIDARLMSGLLEIARIESKKSYIACGIEGDKLFLALPRSGDFLGLGSLFRPVTTMEADLHEALADLTLPPRLIDRLRHG